MLIISQGYNRVIELRHVWIEQKYPYRSMMLPEADRSDAKCEPQCLICAETASATEITIASFGNLETAKHVLHEMMDAFMAGEKAYRLPEDSCAWIGSEG